VILVDTSIWVEHLRRGDATLSRLLEDGLILGHPWVAGELALGNLSSRAEVLRLLESLPQAIVASSQEVMTFIESGRLHGLGIGYVDAQLLASTRLTAPAELWTANRRLAAAAAQLGCASSRSARANEV
jgi:predicted nucleic acid-binding protein